MQKVILPCLLTPLLAFASIELPLVENRGISVQGKTESLGYPDLTYNEWQTVAPYLLPDLHPAKASLDKVFAKGRPTKNTKALEKAGFHIISEGHWSSTIICTHPKVSGFFIKLFTDDQENIDDIRKLINRIKGANLARKIIEEKGWQHLFKAPRKWLYLIPPGEEDRWPAPKKVLLVAEDMNIFPKAENYRRWSSNSFMNPELLAAVFTLITEGGFNDSVYPFNLPFGRDGRIAILDTEKFNGWPIPYYKLTSYLSNEMQLLWMHFIEQGHP